MATKTGDKPEKDQTEPVTEPVVEPGTTDPHGGEPSDGTTDEQTAQAEPTADDRSVELEQANAELREQVAKLTKQLDEATAQLTALTAAPAKGGTITANAKNEVIG